MYLDRLTGRRASTPSLTSMLVGRWVLDMDTHEVFMNSAAAEAGDFVVPDASGHWHVLTDGGERQSGTVARAHFPEELEAQSVRTIGGRVEELVKGGAIWLDWIDVVPLVPGISEQVDLLPLDRLIQDPRNFGALKTVCWKPRAHLHVEVERSPVSKSRRVPAAAASYLAAHTEDWDRPLLRGILPKRILAEVRQDQVDIYENRVAARLLDNLGAYLDRRIQLLRRLLKVFKEREDYSSSIGGTYQREHRMSQLWGESIDANEGRRKAEFGLRELETLKYRLMGLLGSPLYEEVPRRAHVATTLKTTNVLSNDQHYRRVAELWREWARLGGARTQSPAEIHSEAQSLSRGVDAFAMLLAIRALGALGYEPSEVSQAQPIARGTALTVQGHGLQLTMSWRSDGTISVVVGERELAIVSLTVNLTAGGDDRVRESLREIRTATDGRGNRELLVLFLASDDGQASTEADLLASLHTVGNDPRHARAGVGCLPVSPWSLASTERVARSLQWFLSSARFLDYPLRIDVPDGVRDLVDLRKHTRWITSLEGGAVLELRAPPQDHEWEALDVESLVSAAEANLTVARLEQQRLSDEFKELEKRRSHGIKRAGVLRNNMQQEVLRCERVAKASRDLAETLRSAHARVISLLKCPTCSKTADPAREFAPRGRGSFHCTCDGCSTIWGTRICGNGHRFATMLPSGSFVDAVQQGPDWVDRVYGCDILALPALRSDGQWGFLCPKCGLVG